MNQLQNKKLINLYNLALAGQIEEREIKEEIQKTSIEMDRSYVKGENSDDIKEYYSELQKLLETFNLRQ